DALAAKKPPRRGGAVHKAWPVKHNGKKPKDKLAQWLAKQVGPEGAKKRSAHAATASAASVIYLIPPFHIPSPDPAHHRLPTAPAHARLANISYTYDNALATFAFLSIGAKTQAEELLDQLKALQRTDGSIEYAFDVANGTSTSLVRAGAMAWIGYAALAYRET